MIVWIDEELDNKSRKLAIHVDFLEKKYHRDNIKLFSDVDSFWAELEGMSRPQLFIVDINMPPGRFYQSDSRAWGRLRTGVALIEDLRKTPKFATTAIMVYTVVDRDEDLRTWAETQKIAAFLSKNKTPPLELIEQIGNIVPAYEGR